MFRSTHAFTLIELLVVIAIIAILSVVVILTLNPAQLLMQSRDSDRISDMATLNSALGLFAAQGGSPLGNSSTTYTSVPDPLATSTAGDQCQGLGLPALPTGDIYQCEASSSYRNINGYGWIPVNFTSLAAGTPLSELPQDPTNQTSTGLYYTYTTNGSQYQMTAILESQKYKQQFGSVPQDPDYPEVLTEGSNLSLSELYNPNGLVGWWPLTEGSGTTAYDNSGNGNNGGWAGTTIGNNGTYYGGGKVGIYAGDFDGSTDYVSTPTSNFPTGNSSISISAWINYSGTSRQIFYIYGLGITNEGVYLEVNDTNSCAVGKLDVQLLGGGYNVCGPTIAAGTWHYIAASYNGTQETLYVDGQLIGSATGSPNPNIVNGYSDIGKYSGGLNFSGLINDVRVYNRALSAAEIQALYNAEK